MAGPRDLLTTLEQHVMLALVRLHPDGYGITVREEIEKRAGLAVGYGSIYATLDRLEERGFVTSRQGEATAERGGRRKMHFAISAPGRRALDASLAAIDALRLPANVEVAS